MGRRHPGSIDAGAGKNGEPLLPHRRGSEPWYDIAQICLNGHTVNMYTLAYPDPNKKYCSLCGASTITTCQNCGHPVRGFYHIGSLVPGGYSKHSYCINCGNPYPWIDASMRAAQELAYQLDNLTREEQETLVNSLDDLVRDTPRTSVAVIKFKKIIAKAGEGVAESFRTILVNVLVETAKRQIWP